MHRSTFINYYNWFSIFLKELSIRLIKDSISSIILDLLLEGTILGSVFELLLGQLVYFYFFSNIYLKCEITKLIRNRLIQTNFPFNKITYFSL
jgi:hypothetical protein